MNIQFADNPERLADIKVLGIGGAGGNAVNRMLESGLAGVEFHAINTDAQVLKSSRAHQVTAIGSRLTRGLGAGGNPEVGRKAAEEDRELIASLVDGADMVFITAGMGGGTGTGAAPIVAAAAKAAGALTVAIVTKPFLFEGDVRRRQAEAGIAALRDEVDTLIVIPNQRLLEVVPPQATMQEAFRTADDVLYQATRGIYEIIARPAVVNLDFADVRTVMQGMGVALMGTGTATGEDRAIKAARAAVASPLLENVDIRGAQAVLVNLVGAQVTLLDTSQAMQHIQDAAGPQAHIIFGYGNDETLGESLQVTVIATGFPAQADERVVRRVAQATAAAMPEPEPVVEEVAPEPELELEPDPEPEPVMEPVTFEPEPQPVRFDDPTPEVAIEPAAMAAAGGSDETMMVTPPPEPATQSSWETSQRFLRPAGAQDLRPTPPPVPAPAPPPPPSRQAPGGFRSDALLDDLNAPAYTRKYMD